MAALPAPFNTLPPAGVTDSKLLWAIFQQLGGAGSGGSGTPLSVTDSQSGPAQNAAAVTPGAGALSNTTRALFVGTGGDVTVTMAGGGSVVFANVPDGTTIPIAVTHVTAATASDIVALW